MKKHTLNVILDKACFFGLRNHKKEQLSGILPELQNNQNGILIELRNSSLFKKNILNDTLNILDFKEKAGWKIIQNEENFNYPKEKENWITCYANISLLKQKFAKTVILFEQETSPDITEFLHNIEKSCIAVFTENDTKQADIDSLLRLKIAEINIPKTPLFLTAKYSWIFTLLFCVLPFFIASKPFEEVSNLRNITSDVKKYSEKNSIVHVFKQGESLNQIARFAIGKYNSLVSDEKMVKQYLKENNLSLEDKIKAGDTLFLKLPTFKNPHHKSMQGAWSYFTGILNDSLAYITELYNIKETKTKRYHEGIDIGARKGTRILAPFSGIAYTAESERGGLMIAIANKKDILVFMHCEQRFYLNGQSVMEGDPVASVGTTGRTTGPHIHLLAGKITPKGDKNFGTIKYKAQNPFDWYNQKSTEKISE